MKLENPIHYDTVFNIIQKRTNKKRLKDEKEQERLYAKLVSDVNYTIRKHFTFPYAYAYFAFTKFSKEHKERATAAFLEAGWNLQFLADDCGGTDVCIWPVTYDVSGSVTK